MLRKFSSSVSYRTWERKRTPARMLSIIYQIAVTFLIEWYLNGSIITGGA